MTIGEKLCKLRKQKGLSQEAVADAVGVSRQAVSKWERDESLPDLDNVKILCYLFGISIDWLVNEESLCAESPSAAVSMTENFKGFYRTKCKKYFFLLLCAAFFIALFNQIMHISDVPLHSPLWRFTFGIGAPMKKLWAGVLFLAAVYAALLWVTRK